MTIKERNDLFLKNTGVIHHILHKYYPNIKANDELYNELYQNCCYSVLKKLHQFDPDRGELSTFIGMVCKTTVHEYFRAISCPKRDFQTISENELLAGSNDNSIAIADTLLYADPDSDIISSYNVTDVLDLLEKHKIRNADIFIDIVFNGKKQTELAEKYNTKPVNISRRYRYVCKKLRKLLGEEE